MSLLLGPFVSVTDEFLARYTCMPHRQRLDLLVAAYIANV